jgi:branched-chain amino acid transport system permease protein
MMTDRALLKKWFTRWYFHAVALSILFFGSYFISSNPGLPSDIIVFGVFAMAYNFAFGHTGIISMGHGIFFGVSAYLGGMLIIFWQPSIWCMLPAIAAGTILAFIVGYVCFKRTDPKMHPIHTLVFLVLITLAFTSILYYIFLSPLKNISGGEQGLTGVSRQLNVIGDLAIDLRSPLTTHVFVSVIAIISILVMRWIIHSSLGNLAHAIKGNELRVIFLGYDTFWSKVLIFTISGFFTAVAGALYLIRLGFVGLEVFSLLFVGDALLICLMGGRNTVYGPLIGAAIYVAMKDYVSYYTDMWMLIVAVILVTIVIVIPEGILQIGGRLFSGRMRTGSSGEKN